MEAPTALLEIARSLLDAVKGLRSLDDAAVSRSGAPLARGLDTRTAVALLLEMKLIPELCHSLQLPVFVAVQGGTNTGKSTVFNALARKLLSPSVVVASATKHPLVYTHSRWRSTFLGSPLFPGIECRELGDPKEILVDAEREDILYFRFHDDERLSSLAIIDSPDFDGALESNARQAARMAAISDVTLFVTTAQKYRDRVLVGELQHLLKMKSKAIVVFNMVDEQIVYETLMDDLRRLLPERQGSYEAIRLPVSRARHPEDELGDVLATKVLEPLCLLRGEEMKPSIVERTRRGVLDLVSELLARYEAESEFKVEIRDAAAARKAEYLRDYMAGFRLGFPEETLAIRRVLSLTEIGPLFQVGQEVERASKVLAMVGGALRRFHDVARRLLVRLTRSDEGLIESTPAALAEYARVRNKADEDAVLHHAEGMRVRIENHIREREGVSALARELIRSFFTPQFAVGYPAEVRRIHAEALRATGETGEEWLPAVEAWIARSPGKVRAMRLAANALKIGTGLALAWALPPSEGILAVLSPLKWLYFAGGYFLGSYVVCLLLVRRMRRRARFEAARRAAAEATIDGALQRPLEAALETAIGDERLRRIRDLARKLESESAVTARDPARPSTGGGSGKAS